jgi:hypothetical protein
VRSETAATVSPSTAGTRVDCSVAADNTGARGHVLTSITEVDALVSRTGRELAVLPGAAAPPAALRERRGGIRARDPGTDAGSVSDTGGRRMPAERIGVVDGDCSEMTAAFMRAVMLVVLL